MTPPSSGPTHPVPGGATPAAPAPARRVRGRPPGRSVFQEEKRNQTRRTILQAARQVFGTTPYVYATIDDMIRSAGISRATFYVHFTSKQALALAVYGDVASAWVAIFNRLTHVDHGDDAALGTWLDALTQLYTDHGFMASLMLQMQVFEPEFRTVLRRDIDRLITHLGRQGLGGFTRAASAEAADGIYRAEAYLLLRELDLVCTDRAHGDAAQQIQATHCATRVLARLRAFLSVPASHQSAPA